MLRKVASKVAWVGRTASMVFGLALVLALMFGVASAAFGANGQAWILGKANVATAITSLGGKQGVNGPMVRIANNNAGANDTALALNVQAGEPPLRVNRATKVPNLNTDKLDGKDSTQFLAANQKAADSDKVDGFEANQIARATGATNTSSIDDFGPCNFSTIGASKTVTAPTNGILLITGNVRARHDLDSVNHYSGLLHAALALDGTVLAGTQMSESLGAGAEDNEGSIATTTALAVTAGTHTVDLRLAECELGMVFVRDRSITTLFVPFGNAGSVGSLG